MTWCSDDPRDTLTNDCEWLVVCVRVPGQDQKTWLALLETGGDPKRPMFHVYGPEPDKSVEPEDWWPPHWQWVKAPGIGRFV